MRLIRPTHDLSLFSANSDTPTLALVERCIVRRGGAIRRTGRTMTDMPDLVDLMADALADGYQPAA